MSNRNLYIVLPNENTCISQSKVVVVNGDSSNYCEVLASLENCLYDRNRDDGSICDCNHDDGIRDRQYR